LKIFNVLRLLPLKCTTTACIYFIDSPLIPHFTDSDAGTDVEANSETETEADPDSMAEPMYFQHYRLKCDNQDGIPDMQNLILSLRFYFI